MNLNAEIELMMLIFAAELVLFCWLCAISKFSKLWRSMDNE